ncbi:MAG: TetR/AcrR family transcriptional regulator [Deltaproteobacteria bacterium]|nr:TetR/AcrR family transcriptional regulator [Deltaproteobacteria bacterium]
MLSTFKKLPENKQNALLNAAAKVFAKKGYYHANISEICKKAGISNGALYKYFKNKESLYLSVFDYIIDIVSKELFLKHLDSPGPVYLIIQNILNGLVVLAKNHPEMVAIYVDIGSCSMNKLSAPLAEKMEGKAKEFWMELVRRGRQKGEIKTKFSDEGLAYYIDNHITLLAYSLASKYFDTRFRVYFGGKSKEVTDQEKIRTIIKSMQVVLE